MENDKKVFSSDIVRSGSHHRSNLYELLRIVPAEPIPVKETKKYTCDFTPKTDKCYIPKKKTGVKVKTVRSIRSQFESDTYTYLTNELEAQQNYLLNKIRSGCSKDEKTQKMAKKILRCTNPLSRPTWQMLININPEDHAHPRQFVLWNGRHIKVNGSYGGKNKLICDFDLGNTKISLKKKKNAAVKSNAPNKKKYLLRNSLAIKFKPGPLGRKKFLDDSHQKYHGDIELVDLPKVGLVVQPSYGTALEPTITQFINNLREDDGTICEKWAEFAVSVLGEIDDFNPILRNTDSVIFDLRYKYNQNRILMRKDLDGSSFTRKITDTCIQNNTISKDQQAILPEVAHVVNKILDAVEISVNQDNMFSVDDSFEHSPVRNTKDIEVTTLSKDKIKRKFGELGRLDVTVIQLPVNNEINGIKDCGNAYCSLGCVCDSLKSDYTFRQHCGREECMFDCKCDFSKYVTINSLDGDSTDLIPGIINIEDEINMRLAKEEQKFHQTVIVTGKQNILLKSEKRNSKLSKMYETRYKKSFLNNASQKKRKLSLSILKLHCENIEPWCMVHNLYKCFCKGKFTESTTALLIDNGVKEPLDMDTESDADNLSDKTQNSSSSDGLSKQFLRTRIRHDLRDRSEKIKNSERIFDNFEKSSKTSTGISNRYSMKIRKTRNGSEILSKQNNNINIDLTTRGELDTNFQDSPTSENSVYNDTCSRVIAYGRRKFSDEHYKNTNLKIKEMEKNDRKLLQRMNSILKTNFKNADQSAKEVEKAKILNIVEETKRAMEKEKTLVNNQVNQGELKTYPFAKVSNDETFTKYLYDTDMQRNKNIFAQIFKSPYMTKEQIVSWLESSYKLHRKRLANGVFRTSLEPPKLGRMTMYSWDFILSRYKERKNLFLISKQPPYRIFMGVHANNPFFETCININDIRFADLHKYPQTVKNLLTNATDLKDNFCVLRGLHHCWELVGSITKVNKNQRTNQETKDEMANEDTNDETSDIDWNPIEQSERLDEMTSNEMSIGTQERRCSLTLSSNVNQNTFDCSNASDSSKWFIMTVENDFSEIRFYKKGFFVKYESIVKAINVSRISRKTVRLSSHKCAGNNSSPQFGVYAVPNAHAYWVFIGPYELEDTLGVEIIKSLLDVRKVNRTRGFWIVTKKIDNLKVIDNPLSFMPLANMTSNEGIFLETHVNDEKHSNYEVNASDKEFNEVLKLPSKPDAQKLVKPIKIRKTNGFYHLANDGLLKKIVIQSPPKVLLCAPLQKSTVTASPNLNLENTLVEPVTEHSINIENVMSLSTEDSVKENETDIKISAVYSQSEEKKEESKESTKRIEKGMLILKPEEINRKLLQRQLNLSTTSCSQDNARSLSQVAESNQDDTGFSTNIAPYTVDSNVCVISDDESNESTEFQSIGNWKFVLIQCTNVSDLGWVWGRQKRDGLISYIIPGGQYSEFFTEDVAFEELNNELSARVSPSKPFNLQWRVVDTTSSMEREVNPLDFDVLQSECTALEDQSLQIPTELNIKTYSKKNSTSVLLPSRDVAEFDEEVLEQPEDQSSQISTQLFTSPLGTPFTSSSETDNEDQPSQISTQLNIKTYSKKNTTSLASSTTSPAEPDDEVIKPPEDESSQISPQLNIKTYSKKNTSSEAPEPSAAEPEKEVYKPPEDESSQISNQLNIKTYSKKNPSPVLSIDGDTSCAELNKEIDNEV